MSNMFNHETPIKKNNLCGTVLVAGVARGELLVSDTGLSFWGGIDPSTGRIIDEHHPLTGHNVSGKVLAIPGGRGSCSGSGALLELILNDRAPAALVFTEAEDILTLGVLVAEAMFNKSLPILRVQQADFKTLISGIKVDIAGTAIRYSEQSEELTATTKADIESQTTGSVNLTPYDQQFLDGEHGKAAKTAMEIIVRIACIQGAKELIDVSQAHIDACIYHGPSSLKFAQHLVQDQAKVRIPTTLNAISIDERRWRQHGVDESLGEPASQLGYAFMEMGAKASFTCAPYLLNTAPALGDQIVWAESNAVAFANSVIGARTQKYPDFMDIFIALTGRAPASGSHTDAGRMPSVCIEVGPIQSPDDSFWPLLGYHIGLLAPNVIPMIYGLDTLNPSMDDLKAFSAAFATTSSAAMFHINRVTPESDKANGYCRSNDLINRTIYVSKIDLLRSFKELNTSTETSVGMICLGNPHFSITECAALAALCEGKLKLAGVRVLVTMGRGVHEDAQSSGYVTKLESFGIEFITDTCWCMITEPVIPTQVTTLMTNSAKYAHYGPALVKRDMHFGSLAACVNAACTGTNRMIKPAWLVDE